MNQLIAFSSQLLGRIATIAGAPVGVSLKTKNLKLKTIHITPQRGFTLIETFVAITVLLMAIGGPLAIAARGLSSALLAKEQMTASFLAQEVVEYVRWKRDSNALSSRSWLNGLALCTNATCYIDAAADSISSCAGTCPALRYNASTGFYTYSGGSPLTEYTRSVTMTTIGASEAKLTVTVTWTSAGITRQFVAVENIFDWQ